MHAALKGTVDNVSAEMPEALKPAVPIRKSVTPDYIISLEDGKKFKSLKRHLSTHYALTPDEYRAKWGLPADYPMVAPNYAAARSALAKTMGLGRKPKAPEPAAPTNRTRKKVQLDFGNERQAPPSPKTDAALRAASPGRKGDARVVRIDLRPELVASAFNVSSLRSGTKPGLTAERLLAGADPVPQRRRAICIECSLLGEFESRRAIPRRYASLASNLSISFEIPCLHFDRFDLQCRIDEIARSESFRQAA